MPTDLSNLKPTFVENPDEEWKGDAGMGSVRIRPDKVVRSCLIILSTLGVLAAFYFARSILVPLVLAVIVAAPLRPAVEWLAEKRVPRAISALGGLAVIAAVALAVVLPIAGRVRDLDLTNVQTLQSHLTTLRERLAPVLDAANSVQESAESFEDQMQGDGEKAGVVTAASAKDEARKPEEVVVVREQPPALFNAFGINPDTVTTTLSSILIWLVTVYFVLASGDKLIASVIDIGDTAAERNKLKSVSEGVKTGLTSYLTTVTLVNLGLGVAIGLTMWLMGVPGALLIGFMAFLFNFVPMVGALVGMVVAAFVAIMNFPPEDWIWWALVPAAYFTLTTIEGNFVTPSLIGQSLEMNPLIVFLSIVVWGWIWGIPGIIVAVPILAAMKSVFENFESTRDAAAIIG